MYLNIRHIKEKMKDTLMEVLDIRMIETDDTESLEATMEVKQELSQTMGLLHGGAIIALADSVAGIGSNVICNEDEACLGMQISSSLISSAHIGDTVRAKGTIIHKGRTTHVWDVVITSETTKRLIASVRVTNAVVKRKI